MDELKQRIDECHRQIDEAVREADGRARTFISVTAEHIAAQALPMARELGRSQPEASTQLGADGLRELVKEVAEYAANARSICEDLIYRETAWAHLVSEDDGFARGHRRDALYLNDIPRGADNLAQHVFDCLGRLGTILRTKGFTTSKRGEPGYDPDSVPHARLCALFKWSDHMRAAYEECEKANNALHALKNQLKKLEEERLRRDSEGLWDAAAGEEK